MKDEPEELPAHAAWFVFKQSQHMIFWMFPQHRATMEDYLNDMRDAEEPPQIGTHYEWFKDALAYGDLHTINGVVPDWEKRISWN